MPGPLDGIKVFEVSQIVAGPYCGLNLVDLGADVIKVEPPGGEGIRQSGGFVPGESKGFHSLNRGKRSLVMDLQSTDAQELVHRIIAGFDVFVINARLRRAGAAARGLRNAEAVPPGPRLLREHRLRAWRPQRVPFGLGRRGAGLLGPARR